MRDPCMAEAIHACNFYDCSGKGQRRFLFVNKFTFTQTFDQCKHTVCSKETLYLVGSVHSIGLVLVIIINYTCVVKSKQVLMTVYGY